MYNVFTFLSNKDYVVSKNEYSTLSLVFLNLEFDSTFFLRNVFESVEFSFHQHPD